MGVRQPSFKEACVLRNLLVDDTEWDKTLAEASSIKMPSQVRTLFAMICAQCEPMNPHALWLSHKDAMTEDYMHFHHLSAPAAEQVALSDIETLLQEFGFT